MRLESTLDIRAPVEKVWALTEDIEAWPSMTPTITSVERLDHGPIDVGSRARIKQPRQRPAVWTVTRFDRPQLFEWATKIGPVTMTAAHRLEETAEGCRNIVSIELSGFGSGLLGRLVGRRVREAIETENRGFKQRAEAPN